jgi:RNA polymerase sigma-70 factor (ECF subfamily)
MAEHDWLAEQFEANRVHLQAVAYRMLGSQSEAEDAVQEAWFRLTRSETNQIANLRGWLTTVVGRICMDILRRRVARREESLVTRETTLLTSRNDDGDPEHEALIADSVGLALLVVLDTLAPAERLAFVLHDIFGVPFDEIAAIVERSPEATRKLASRARQRVRGATASAVADLAQQRAVVDAFLSASREGNFEALLAVLDPDVVLRADSTAMSLGGAKEVRGALSVARHFLGRAQAARPALVQGALGVVVAPNGQLLLILSLEMRQGKIVAIEAIADPTHLHQLDLVILNG